MGIDWVALFSGIPAELAIFIIAMIPAAEKAALPLALQAYHLPIWSAFIITFIGSILPVALVLLCAEPVTKYLMRWKIFNKFFNWLFDHTRKKFYKKHEKWGNIALIIFVSTPLPITGIWTGAVAAWLFGIKLKIALLYIGIGAIISGVITTLLTMGVIKIF